MVANYAHSPTVDPIRDTAWGAWNAVTEFEQHKQDVRNSKRDMAERKTEFAFFGTDADDSLGQRALSLLTADWDSNGAKAPKRKRSKATQKVA